MNDSDTALLPTAHQLMEAIAGKHGDDPLLRTVATLLPLNKQRFMTLGTLLGRELPARAEQIYQAGAVLTSAVVGLSRAAHTIDCLVAQRLMNLPSPPGTPYTTAHVGELAAMLGFFRAREDAGQILGHPPDPSEQTSLCEAYTQLRCQLLAGKLRPRHPGPAPTPTATRQWS
ncbi:hypothetical protein IU500_22045 [Nocardia terpenica]|uniref:hypothetical protein n=1 Tax=Nocardia terpenica TaxID=455432 RepID=UPI001893546F|nr:hypothetical protein [Nocardia terpenica]MBF6064655.1 hypothetical protein [Nocardia terpenica]MBF6106721.1 hypothetical protein [Nocardia terpenica]MBF6114623.1 hypothetical protein [Nocardia terpenica]MBF6121291.1 hypothetical protein [Nocardia terpenica]MBF6153706.1 hypothetical protein [Nocardia terpenica]